MAEFLYFKETITKLVCSHIESNSYLWLLGQEIGVVEGSPSECGDRDYPGIFVRLDDADVLNFIKSIMRNEGKYYILRY